MFTLRAGWRNAIVSGSGFASATRGTHAQLLWTYGPSALLVWIPEDEIPILQANAGEYVVRVQSETVRGIDIRQGIPPDVPAEQRFDGYPPGERGAYVIQFIGLADPAWLDEVARHGAIIGRPEYPDNDATIVTTPEEAARIQALPYIQFLDFLHPFLKASPVPEPKTYYDSSVFLFDVPGHENVLGRLRAQGLISLLSSESQTYDGMWRSAVRFRGADLLAILREPLVATVAPSTREPVRWNAFPRRAPAGTTISLFGVGGVPDVFFGEVRATEIASGGGAVVRVRVPQTLGPGPVDITVVEGEYRQVIPGESPEGFTVDPTALRRVTMTVGDVLLTGGVVNMIGETVPTFVSWNDPQIRERARLNSSAAMIYFDPDGFLVEAAGNDTRRLDAELLPASPPPAYAAGATHVAFNREGEAFVEHWNDRLLRHYARDGRMLHAYDLGFSAGGDLAADNCTYVYASGAIERYDVCRGVPLPRLAGQGGSAAVRIGPDDNIYGFMGDHLAIFGADGHLIAEHPEVWQVGSMEFSPDGRSLWIRSYYDSLVRYDLATWDRTELTPRDGSTGLAIYGAWSAARGTPAYAVPLDITRVDRHGETITILGR